jgi:hypothetical protein
VIHAARRGSDFSPVSGTKLSASAAALAVVTFRAMPAALPVNQKMM